MSFLPSASMFAKFLLFPSGQCFHKDPGWSWHFCISATFGANFIQCCVFIPWTFSVEKSPDSFVCLILENCIQDLLHAKQKTKCLPHPPRDKTGHIIACLFVLCAIYPVGIFRDTSVVCAGPVVSLQVHSSPYQDLYDFSVLLLRWKGHLLALISPCSTGQSHLSTCI